MPFIPSLDAIGQTLLIQPLHKLQRSSYVNALDDLGVTLICHPLYRLSLLTDALKNGFGAIRRRRRRAQHARLHHTYSHAHRSRRSSKPSSTRSKPASTRSNPDSKSRSPRRRHSPRKAKCCSSDFTACSRDKCSYFDTPPLDSIGEGAVPGGEPSAPSGGGGASQRRAHPRPKCCSSDFTACSRDKCSYFDTLPLGTIAERSEEAGSGRGAGRTSDGASGSRSPSGRRRKSSHPKNPPPPVPMEEKAGEGEKLGDAAPRTRRKRHSRAPRPKGEDREADRDEEVEGDAEPALSTITDSTASRWWEQSLAAHQTGR